MSELSVKKLLCLVAAMCATGMSGCVDSDCADGMCEADSGYDFSVHRAPLAARCSIYVSGYGAVDMETDYVPNVTACENGGAGTAGLQAQAVAARTFAYYKLSIGAGTEAKPINNSQGDQVYKCSYTTAAQKHYDAANSTSGIVLTYAGAAICSFYVSGCVASYLDADCVYRRSDCTTTQQKYVTYNKGKSGSNVTQSTLGWVSSTNKANRGCMSQNGAKCLSDAGHNYEYILKFFYGDDIGITQAAGSCIAAKTCDTKIPAAGGTLEESDNCFTRSSSTAWYELAQGSGSHLYYTYVWDKAADVVGTWKLNMVSAGTYKVEAYIQPNIGAMSEQAPYVVRAKGQETTKKINLSGKSGWVTIGTFEFAAGGDQYVKLSDASGEPYTDENGKRIVFDAIRLTPVQTCSDACTNGAKECSGNGVRTCSKGSNGCTSWSSVTACGDGKTCSNGECVAACTNECNKGEVVCNETGTGYKSCNTSGACLVWSDEVACGEGFVCDGGQCLDKNAVCENECTEGMTECVGNGVRSCTKNAVGCDVWSATKACSSSEICSDGACVDNPNGTEEYEPWSGKVEDMPEACVTEIDGRPSVIIDDLDPCFTRAASNRWSEIFSLGHDNHLYYAYIVNGMPSAVGTWHLNVKKTGKYTVYAYIDSAIGAVSSYAPYIINASGVTKTYGINQSGPSGWYRIDDVELTEGQHQYVQLLDTTSEELGQNASKRVVFDAIQIVPYGTLVENVVDPSKLDEGNAGDTQDPDDDSGDADDNAMQMGSSQAEASCSASTRRGGAGFPLLALLGAGFAGLGLRRRSLQK